MTGIDAVVEIVLGNVKLPSEKADGIVPFLRQLKQCFGPPLALVHDMSKGILAAIQKVFPGLPDFICHFHFLRDLGKDLFGAEYDTLRKRLQTHGTVGQLRARSWCWPAGRRKSTPTSSPSSLWAPVKSGGATCLSTTWAWTFKMWSRIALWGTPSTGRNPWPIVRSTAPSPAHRPGERTPRTQS